MRGVILRHQKPPPPRSRRAGGFFWEGGDVARPPRPAPWAGVHSSWVGPRGKAPRGGGCACAQGTSLCSSQTSPESRASQPDHIWVNVKRRRAPSRARDGPGCPRYPVPPTPRKPPHREGTLRLGGVAAEGSGGGRPARAGLHRPLLGKPQGCSEIPAGTSLILGVWRDGTVGWAGRSPSS